jgi:hypothetical protein
LDFWIAGGTIAAINAAIDYAVHGVVLEGPRSGLRKRQARITRLLIRIT